MQKRVVIVGAGPAGLTAAYQLAKASVPVTVLESNPTEVGGLSRTVERDGFRVDIGGHRFYSKSAAIENLWTELLPDDFLVQTRHSRILYRNRFFTYPLKPFEALARLGPLESSRCALSYAKARLLPHQSPETFEQWVTNEFGSRLYEIFFKTYTEKVWGTPCSQISADWAAQRIGELSLSSAIAHAFLPQKNPGFKTLIQNFRYPIHGPGMVWAACAERIRRLGGEVHLGRRMESLRWDGQRWRVETNGPHGRETWDGTDVVSTGALKTLTSALGDGVSSTAQARAEDLRYRDFLIVAVTAKPKHFLRDQWIYVHDERFRVGRVQNFRAWSPEMVPNAASACFGMEYFCHEGDGLWSRTDEQLRHLAQRELIAMGFVRPAELTGGFVVRQKKAYPVYHPGYAKIVADLRTELQSRFPTLHLAGRNGMHKYNNQDHAMMTGWIAAENIVAGKAIRDPWAVNQDAEYLESRGDTDFGTRLTPHPVGGLNWGTP